MPDTTELSEIKRALLEKYVRGNLPQVTRDANIIPRRSPGSSAPLSFGQQQLWLLAQLIPNTPVYNESVTVHLPGPLEVAALELSLNEIIRRHEAWRTSFPLVDGQPVQVIHPAPTLTLPIADLRHLHGAEREVEVLRLTTEETQQPFDLVRGPLLRFTLMRLDNTDHRLLITLHHIIFDGITIYQVFLSELRTLYEAFSTGQPSPLPDLPIQYADFAVWQRKWLQGKVLAEQLDYWKKQLAGAPAVLELPTDRPNLSIPTYRGSILSFALSRPLTDALRALSSRERSTLYMTLTAAFNTLLYRYTGQDDILIGAVTGGRKHPEVQKLMGVFINPLVMRTNLAGNPSFRELLGRVREVTIDATVHQDVPFEYLVKELQPERQMGQNPFFQVMLVLEPAPVTLPSGWTLAPLQVNTGTSKFDLSLILEDRPEGLTGYFEYSTDLFDAATIVRMAGHLQTLLEGIVAHPEQRLSELPMLTEAERQLLLIEWNATSTAFPQDRCVHQLFEAQVERTPEGVAVVLEDEHLTYRELNSKANQLAHYLQQLGVGPEVLVGICVERSLEMVVGLLAILKAGGAFVPLDPATPQDRLAAHVQDSQLAVLLTQQRLLERLPKHSTQIICLDTGWEVIAQQRTENPLSKVTTEHLAYVIYTSGSTGKPKGVPIEHGSIARHSCTVIRHYELAASDRVLQFSTFTFDASLEQILPTLIVGATLILRGPEVWSITDFQEKMRDFGLTVINLPTAYWHQLAQAWAHEPEVMPNHHLRLMIVGGDRMVPDYLNLWLQIPAMRAVRLLNAYGPTETTITATTFEVPSRSSEGVPFENISIGRPLAQRTVYILDTHGSLVPIGVQGELHIGGDLLARGYLNRPDLTAERFIPDPFSKEAHAHLYKTGDLVRYRPDGNIEFLGRIDHQVKIRGFRIELGEIEEVLRQHPEVRETVVVAREDTPGDKRLVAYIVAAQGQTPSINNLRSSLKEKLPEYMLPSVFMLLDALPLTPNSKVDRHALPAPEPARQTAEQTFVAPALTVHYQLLQIWEELLDARPIGIRDNFFFLGGHSLLATRLVNRIEQVFGKKIPLATLFAGPTIEDLAIALEQQEDTGSWSPSVAVQTGGSKRPFFFLHGDYKGGAFYCFPLARGLGSDQPFYALEPFRVDDLGVALTLEAMAAVYIKSLRAVQPEGPYLLGGFCGGGLVAYEVARQLHAQGQKVDLLVLMDPTPIGYARLICDVIKRFGNLLRLDQEKQLDCFLWLGHMYRYLLHMYRYLRYPHYRGLKNELDSHPANLKGGTVLALKELYELKCSQGTERLVSDEQIEQGRRRNKLGFALPKLDAIFPDAIFSTSEALRQDQGIFYWVTADYMPSTYPGKSTFFFFWDSERHWRRKAWRKVAEAKDKEVEVHIVAGTHVTCKTEYLHDLTEHLRLCLSKAQEV